MRGAFGGSKISIYFMITSENVSVDVGSTGALSNQFIEGMKRLYELEPLIKVKPYSTNRWEKGSLAVKRAS